MPGERLRVDWSHITDSVDVCGLTVAKFNLVWFTRVEETDWNSWLGTWLDRWMLDIRSSWNNLQG